ncbi:IclR family transcriptional regulator domain-containing protein [Actinomadura madurae]|uniref:IclR family transcriptional regulator domain-containing protein n=1 Tax=Actinomadura madurae TaxID=1993 RepID=UPI003FD78DDA
MPHPGRRLLPRGQPGPLRGGPGSPTTGADPASRCSRSATRSSRSPCWRDSNRTDGPALRDRLQEIREAGYCVSRGEFLPETGAVGAPVFGVHGDHAIAGVSVSGVVGRLADDRLPELTAAVMAAGESISRGLAYSGPYPRPA